MKSKAEHDFETKQLAESVCRQIDRIIGDLQTMKLGIEAEMTPYEHHMPQQPLIDLAIRYGELVAMKRLSCAFQDGA